MPHYDLPGDYEDRPQCPQLRPGPTRHYQQDTRESFGNRDNMPSCDGSPRASTRSPEAVVASPRRSSIDLAVGRLSSLTRQAELLNALIRETFAKVLTQGPEASPVACDSAPCPPMCDLGNVLLHATDALEQEFVKMRATINCCDL